MGSAQITQIPVATQPVQFWVGNPNSQDQILVWNQDLNNNVYIGNSSNISVNGGDTLPIPPNGAFQLAASRSYWVVGGTTGIANLVVIPSSLGMFRGITQGLGNLAIPSIHSPNYSPGVSGWTIKKDGSAEFNNLTIRGNFVGPNFFISNGDGTLTNIPGFFLYNGTPAAGNLIWSSTAGAGNDIFNNNFLAGDSTYDNVGLVAENRSFGTTGFFTFTAQPNAVFTAQGIISDAQSLSTGLFANGVNVGDLLQITSGGGLISNLQLNPNGNMQVVNGADSALLPYTMGHSIRILGASILINSTTPITVFTVTNIVPGYWRVEGKIRFTSATGTIQPMLMRIAGNATLDIVNVFVKVFQEITQTLVNPGVITAQNADPSVGPNLGNSLTYWWEFMGYVHCSAPGSFIITCRQGVSSANEQFTVLTNSWMELKPTN